MLLDAAPFHEPDGCPRKCSDMIHLASPMKAMHRPEVPYGLVDLDRDVDPIYQTTVHLGVFFMEDIRVQRECVGEHHLGAKTLSMRILDGQRVFLRPMRESDQSDE